jgi:hypothetical protein
MVLAGACFTPAIILGMRLVRFHALPELHATADFWMHLWSSAWESSAIFFLPMGAVLATSLIVQIEFRNDTWKQVHTLPIGPATIYFSKLAIILLMLAQFLLLFDVALWLTAALPALLVPGVGMPTAPIPWSTVLRDDVGYAIGVLPIVGLQYAIALRHRNVMVPVGAGFLLWVGTLGMLSTRWGSLSPYAATMIQYIGTVEARKLPPPPIDVHVLALGYFFVFVAVGYGLFAHAPRKG